MRQEVITANTNLPVPLSYVKLSIKHTSGDVEDDLLTTYIKEAAATAESYTGLRLMKTTLADYHDSWCTRFVFWNAANVLSVDKIEYMPEGSTTYTTLAASKYIADLHAAPAAVKITADSLPAINCEHPEAIKITYKAGYSDSETEADQQEAIPVGLKQAITLIASHWYQYRVDYAKKEGTPASTVLLNRYKVAWI